MSVSPALMFAISWSYQPCIASAMILVSSVRAAVRPSVENSASTGTSSVDSVMSTSSFACALPVAYSISMRASGPTSIELPFQRGDLSQL